MHLSRSFDGLAFTADTLNRLDGELGRIVMPELSRRGIQADRVFWEPEFLNVSSGVNAWGFEKWAEFIDLYRTAFPANAAYFALAGRWSGSGENASWGVDPVSSIVVELHRRGTEVRVSGDSRAALLEAVDIFESDRDTAAGLKKEEAAEPVRIFLGHGRSDDWRDLKDHLHEKQGYDVEAFEVGERAGHSIRDVLESMLDRSSFALLVMTAEDEMADGNRRARQNVVHEAGLFQGRLGFKRAIAVEQKGVEVFSNLDGIQRLQYETNIKEVFGDVLATLRREFGGS